MAVLLTPPYLQFFDDNGDPLSGGKIYTYAAGTLTPKATYTDASETTPLSNPVVLDSAGRATIWISGSYYIDVKTSADVPVKNTDNITAFNTASSSINSLLPSQTGNAGRFLITDGSNVSWGGGSVTILRNHIDGFTMSTAGSSTTMTIGAGQAANSTNTAYMTLASSVAKTTGAWSVGSGNGGLDTGSIANNTWYHFYAIRRPDTDVVDVVFSTNSTSPTLPTNYTQFRRIGSGLTNGSAQWIKFIQVGNKFTWDSAVLDINDGASGTSAKTGTLASVPLGVVVNASLQAFTAANGTYVHFSPLSVSDQAPSTSSAPLAFLGAASGSSIVGNNDIITNTSQQFRYRTSANDTLRVATLGWTDFRGQE